MASSNEKQASKEKTPPVSIEDDTDPDIIYFRNHPLFRKGYYHHTPIELACEFSVSDMPENPEEDEMLSALMHLDDEGTPEEKVLVLPLKSI